MYRCSVCNSEFKEKPQYCDCGNDEFIFIEEQTAPKETAPTPTKAPVVNEYIEEEIERPKQDIFGLIFFICSLILALIIVIFPVKQNEQNASDIVSKENKTVQNIKSIDEIWDNTLPKVVNNVAPQVQEQSKEIQPKQEVIVLPEVKEARQNPKIQVKAQDLKQTQKQSQPKTQQKPTQTVAKIPTTPKPTQPISAPTKVQTQTQPKTTTQTQPKTTTTAQKQTQSRPIQVQTKPAQTTQTTQTTAQKQPQTVKATTSVSEINQYKKALRNKIASKIDFLDIVGDGSAVLSFKVSSSGMLYDKKFETRSSNISLNDELYQAMLSMSSFSNPPSGLVNKTLRLSVKIVGENFQVSLN